MRVAGLAGGDLPQGLRVADQLVQGLHNAGEARSVGTLLLPAVKHQLVDGFWTVHGSWQAVALLDGLDDILITPVPVGPLPIAHHLPHNNAEAPSVRGRGELPEGDGLRCCPSHRYLSSPGGVSAVDGGLADLPGQPEVGDLANELRVDEDIPCREIAMHVVHFGEILHSISYTPHHSNELHSISYT